LRNGIYYSKYNDWTESVNDLAVFLTQNNLQTDGYAGNITNYAPALINIIERYELMQYDSALQSNHLPVFPGVQNFGLGKNNDYILLLGQQIVKKGYSKHYKKGPSKKWGEADRLKVQDFQLAHGWKGSGANGLPGPVTWQLLMK
jgi:hypothetical protein